MKTSVSLFLAAALATPLWTFQAAAQAADMAKPAKANRAPIVTNAWARATVPAQAVGAAYMSIVSPVNTRLLDAHLDVASVVEVHDMHTHEGMMQMRAHGPLELVANQRVELAPGGTHFMLMGLKRPLKAGETLQMTLTFGQSNTAKVKHSVTVDVPVRPIGQ